MFNSNQRIDEGGSKRGTALRDIVNKNLIGIIKNRENHRYGYLLDYTAQPTPLCISTAMKATKDTLSHQYAVAESNRIKVNQEFQIKSDVLIRHEEQLALVKLEMQQKIAKLEQDQDAIARETASAITESEKATKEAQIQKEKHDIFIEDQWTPMFGAGFAGAEGNPDLPFSGATAADLERTFQITDRQLTTGDEILAALKILKTFGGEQSKPFMAQMFQPGGVMQITASRSKGQSVSELTELLQKFLVLLVLPLPIKDKQSMLLLRRSVLQTILLCPPLFPAIQ